MAEQITAVVFRYDPDTDREPRYQEYLVEADEKMSVLVLLDRIQKDLDETLSFRSYCCGLQMCRSCLMEINGKKQFACLSLVAPGDRVTVAPRSFPSGHVKDLVVEPDKRGEGRTMTIVEKILARASGQPKVAAGQQVTARIDMAMMPDAFRLIRSVLAQAGIREETFKVWDPEKFVAVLDHRVPPTSIETAKMHKAMRDLARNIGVKYFYDVFPGICHQIMVEKGHVVPGDLVVGADSHTTTYGAVNAASTGIGASEMAYVLKTGELWFKVPETIRVEITGSLAPFVHSKDIILEMAGNYSTEVAQYKAIEWVGQAVDEMTLDSRMTMGNMSVELGAKFGIFRADKKTIDYLRTRTTKPLRPVEADPDAVYAERYVIDGAGLAPKVALPHNVGNVKNASEVKDVRIDQAVIASCCHGRMEDMEVAARMVKGKRVYPGVRFYVAPASWEEYKSAVAGGLISTLLDAGVMIGNPSCGFCTGLQGVLADGEVCVAASPRNFRGRMGSNDALIYLASPATVAASALAGKIVDPREVAR